jgi:hypothetical protein
MNVVNAMKGAGNAIVGYGVALARATDPGTSHEAAASFDPTDLEQVVLGAVMLHTNGAIQDDVLGVLEPQGYKYGTITPRFRSLLNKGLLVPTGEKRKAKSGRSQRVLKVNPAKVRTAH